MWSKERNTGKSTLHQALSLLFKKGAVDGVRPLNEQFNRIIAGAVLCYIDEEEVKDAAAQRLKSYLTSDRISIRQMRTDTFMLPNYTHWIGAFNDTESAPIKQLEERVVVFKAFAIDKEDEMPWKDVLKPALEKEASDFLGTLLEYPIPDASAGRLFLPVLDCGYSEVEKKTWKGKPLLTKLLEIAERKPYFVGSAGELADLIDLDGPLNQLKPELRKLAHDAQLHGLTIDLSGRKVIWNYRRAA